MRPIVCSIIAIVFLLHFLVKENYGEVTYFTMNGLSTVMPNVNVPLKNTNPTGTVVSILGVRQKNVTIKYLNLNNRTITSFDLSSMPNTEGNYYHVTIQTEDNGYRVYFQGEEIKFYAMYMEAAARVLINQGTLKVVTYYKEPIWTLDQSYHNIKVYNFEPTGLTKFPKVFDLVNFNSAEILNGDYLIVTGEILDVSQDVNIELVGKDLSPLRVTFEPEKFKMILRSTENNTGKDKTVMNYSRIMNQTGRFTIVLVCEELGWRIYYNGEEFAFYFHQFAPKLIKQAKFLSNSDNDKNWKLLKFTIKHT